MISNTELSQKIFSYKKVGLICHMRPDGDTLGSALALCLAMQKKGIDATVYCSDLVPEKFYFLPQTKKVSTNLCGDFDALIAIDCADITRLGELDGPFLSHKETIVIDHHISNTRYAKTNYINDLSSNCELMYGLINLAQVEIDEQMANLLAMGIMTDTGNFKHKNVSHTAFSVMAELVKLGANTNLLYYHMFTKQTKERAKLYGKVMSKIRYELDERLAIISIFQADLQETNAKKEETEGFIDFIMGIEGVEVGACLLEVGNKKFKVSFRSKSTNVNAVASEFGGGGHVLASGCQINAEYEEVIDRITFAVKKNIIE